MKIISVCAQSFGANTYLLISGGEALAVDPSVSVSAMVEAARGEGAEIVGVLLTHGHFDHMLSLDSICENLNVPSYIHESDAELLTDGKKNAFYTFFGKERVFRAADNLLSDGDVITLGNEKITVLHTPGHTMGSVCYLSGDILVTGDTLFAEAIGRQDLYGGSPQLMADSLHRLEGLDGSITIYPGHGPSSSLRNAIDGAFYFI